MHLEETLFIYDPQSRYLQIPDFPHLNWGMLGEHLVATMNVNKYNYNRIIEILNKYEILDESTGEPFKQKPKPNVPKMVFR